MATASFARRERRTLCDLALLLGSDAPTLCGDWTVKDLVVHLLVRERRPLGALGIVAPPLAGLTARSTARLLRRDFPVLVERLREPGLVPFALGPIEVAMNTVEHFVHTEDLRRAQPDWGPRDLPDGDEDALWRALGPFGLLLGRSAGVPLRIARSDRDSSRTLARGPDPVTVTGRPSEITLFLFGRDQADVDLVGPEPAVARLRTADLGF